jgi:hypothetical protein
MRGRKFGRASHRVDNLPKENSVQSGSANVHAALSFVIAIVLLRQIRFHLGNGSQPGQGTRQPRALPRAGEHTNETDGAATVLPACARPFSLTGSNEDPCWWCAGRRATARCRPSSEIKTQKDSFGCRLRWAAPLPITNFRQVLTVFVDILLVLDQLVL